MRQTMIDDYYARLTFNTHDDDDDDYEERKNNYDNDECLYNIR